MKVLVICAVLLTTICSKSSAEIDEDFLKDESFEADGIVPFFANEEFRKDKRNCIPRNQECTIDKRNCCRRGLFKMTCQCMKSNDESGQPTEKCTCRRPRPIFHLLYKGLLKG
uniref:Toxin 33 isoform b n=1 Tax=Cupiennius salei TaxID=6928 RepID=A0A4Y5UGK2_CUPSA|nr:toxin 33 isoform b precursor [Cupiennius salei]